MRLEKSINQIGGGRNSSIDLLKIIAITMVVCLHVSPTLFEHYPSIIGTSIIHGLRSYFMLGVTIFAFISGYYGVRWSDKFYNYYLVVLFYGVSFAAFDILVNGINSPKHYTEFLLPISGNGCWYASSYLLLLLLHRFVPLEVLDKYSGVDKREFFLFLLICYVGQFMLGADGTNFLMLLQIYIIGRFMYSHPRNFIEKHSLKIFLVSSIILICSFLLVSYIDIQMGLDSKLIDRFANNRNPLLLITSMSLFYLVKSKDFYSEIITNMASYTLTIYVIHAYAKHSILDYEKFSSGQYPFLSFILSVVLTIALCIIVEYARRKLIGFFIYRKQ